MWVGDQRHVPDHFTRGKETRYTLHRKLFGAPGPVWTGAENLAPIGIRFPDLPDCSDSLYEAVL